jgi:general stress protein 26
VTPAQKSNVLEILDAAKDLTIATVREDGYPQATIVSFVHDGLSIYFGCGRHSQKARNLERSDKVSGAAQLPYERWDEIRGISLGGRARFVTEPPEIARVMALMVERFPQIHEYATEGEEAQVRLVRVDPVVISILDYRRGFGHTEEVAVA